MSSALSFVLMTSCALSSAPFAVDVSSDIIAVIRKHYHFSCVFLVHDDVEETWNLLAKLMSLHGVTIGHVHAGILGNYSEETKCDDKPPLHFLPSSDRKSQQLLHELSKGSSLRSGKWLMILDPATSVEKFFADIHIPFDCEFLVAEIVDVPGKGGTSVALTEVYRVQPAQPLQKYRAGNWSPPTGLAWSTLPFHQRRPDLQGITIRAAIVADGIFATVKKYEGQRAVEFDGYMIELWTALEHELNFTTQFFVPEDGVFGSLDVNRTWNGMIKMILEDKVEFGIGGFVFTSERMAAVHFLPPTRTFKMKVFIRQPKLEETSGSFVVSPFTGGLWTAIIITAIALTMALKVAWNVRAKSGLQKSEDWASSVFLIFSIFCQQGDIRHLGRSCSLICLSAHVTAVVLLDAYSATLTSLLAVRRHELPFTDFESLVNDGTYRVIVGSGSAHLNYFNNPRNPVLREVYRKLIEPGIDSLPKSVDEGLAKMCDHPKIAYVASDLFLRIARSRRACSVVPVDKASYLLTESLVLSKKSPYRRVFSSKVQDMRRSGILSRAARHFWPPLMPDMAQSTLSTVTMTPVGIIFVALATGTLTSALFLVLESVPQRSKQRKGKRRERERERADANFKNGNDVFWGAAPGRN
ncbi:hypothetical protein L798_15232 [Zootermopsis nevadensis]|uniref:Ionotropic glutamate receptor L-glutamate and glycine-binding domain-containing protein n=1 Tax=Zootermopsis nevadensis TaxID=136037 RepID=A0A067RRB1_ZOONE|nr:hypothetical protein L798_15232 [Zootermopsis nevadensis]